MLVTRLKIVAYRMVSLSIQTCCFFLRFLVGMLIDMFRSVEMVIVFNTSYNNCILVETSCCSFKTPL